MSSEVRNSTQYRLRRCIAHLPEADREVWHLHQIEHRDSRWIACRLRLSSYEVQLRLWRAKRRLRAILRQEFGSRLRSRPHLLRKPQ
ncbi:MAG: sigma-70 family RNA polymerase sigma factor [Bryobacteraceae bacterium]|nr:sigma-70 family RNA polymerase sigma factor [Bryobacteraceae bacterium]